jgi:copper transport protein
MKIKRGLIAVWLVLSLSVVLVGTAAAHALLVRSEPAANADLLQSPTAIELWFSEALESGFSSARVLNATGQEMPAGTATVDDADPNHLSLPVNELAPGIYTVAWKTLSRADGHEWYGSFPFTVLNPDGSRPSGTVTELGLETHSELPTPAQAVARWLALLGGIMFLGAPLFYKATIRSGEDVEIADRLSALVVKSIGAAVLLVIAGSWLQIALQAGQLENLALLPRLIYGTRLGALALARQALMVGGLLSVLVLTRSSARHRRDRLIFTFSIIYEVVLLLLVVMAGLQGEVAIAALTLIVSAIALMLTLRARRTVPAKQPWAIVLALGAVVLLTFSAGSHAGAAPGSVWAILGDYVHLLAAAAWIGGLVLLPILVWQLRRSGVPIDRDTLWSIVRRYSYLASFAVFVLIVTGVFNGLIQLSNLTSLFNTAYGRVLLIKLAIIAGLLGVALLNNRLVHRKANQARDLARFNRQVALESIGGVLLMLVVAVFVQTQPPRDAALSTSAFAPELPFNDITPVDDLYAHVQVSPNRAGENRFWVHLYRADGTAIGDVQLVRMIFNYRDAELGQATAELKPLGQDVFALDGAYLNQAGAWDLSIYVRRRGVDDAIGQLRLTVPASTPATTASSDPWQNPITALPIDGLLAVLLIGLGVMPLLWYRLVRQTWPDLFWVFLLIGGVLIVVGGVTGVAPVTNWLAQFSAPPETQASTNPIAATADSIEIGSLIYQQHCAVCHGPTGAGDGPQAAALNPKPANLRVHLVPGLHSDAQLFEWLTDGLPNTAMPAFGDTLSADQRWQVINYIRTFAVRQ